MRYTYALLSLLQLHRIFRYLNRKNVIILMYHGFSFHTPNSGSQSDELFKLINDKHLNVETFKSQLNYLKQRYHVISLKEAIECYKNNITLPEYSVILTFDDGYRSNYVLAYPILKNFNLPATIFITTSFVDNKQPLWTDRVEFSILKAIPNVYTLQINKSIISLDLRSITTKKRALSIIKSKLKKIPHSSRLVCIENLEKKTKFKLSLSEKDIHSKRANRNDSTEWSKFLSIYSPLKWEEVREMNKSNLISVGSHTHNHEILTQCTAKELEDELAVSRDIIQKNLKGDCTMFCYPNGSVSDFDSNTQHMLKRLGYSCALTTVCGFNTKNTNIFELKRVGVGNQMTLSYFKVHLSGLNSIFIKLRTFLLK